MYPYKPGDPPKRAFSGYSVSQESCWQAVDTVYHAHYFGYADTRQPTPGGAVDPVKYTNWQRKLEAAWTVESNRDVATRGLTCQDLGDNAMRHLYERFQRAVASQSIIGARVDI